MTTSHLSDQQLREFLNGNDEGYADVLEHIEQCKICEERLKAIVRIDTTHSSVPRPNILSRDAKTPVENLNPAIFQIEQSQRFEISHEIAEGGMGIIYEAEDQLLRRTVALKVIKPEFEENADATARFIQEARICGMLQHPGIVPVHDLGLLDDSKPFLTMKLIDGQTLADLIKKQTPVTRLLEIFAQVCQTMAYVHSRDVIHRDIKPANIMVGEFGEVQIMDWGISKLLNAEDIPRPAGEPNPAESESELHQKTEVQESANDDSDRKTQTGMIIGTPGYMPPEQARGEVDKLDKRADVFALGAMLCEILTGHPPGGDLAPNEFLKFAQQPDYSTLDQRLSDSQQDPMLTNLVKACLANNLDERPCDANTLSEVIAEWKSNAQLRLKQVEIEFARSENDAANEKKRRKLTIAIAGLILALVASVTGALLYLAGQNAKTAANKAEALQKTLANDRQINRYLNDAIKNRAIAIEKQTLNPETWQSVLHSVELAENLADEDTSDQLQVLISNLKADINLQISAARNNALTQQRYAQTTQQLKNAQLKLIDYEQDRIGDTEQRKAVGLYEQAFNTFGIDVQCPVEEAVDLFVDAPQDIQESLVSALQLWHQAYFNFNENAKENEDYEQWLREIYEKLDYKDRRIRLRSAFLNNDIETVVEIVDDIIVVDDVEYLIAAEALRRSEKHAERRKLLEKSVNAFPNNFWLNYHLATDYQERNPLMIDSALSHYFVCGAIEPDSYLPMNNVGAIYIKQRKNDLALAHFQRLIEIRPDRAVYRVNLASILMTYRRLPEAIVQLNKAIELDPQIVQGYVNLGEIHSMMKKFDDAKTAYEKAIEINPELPDTYLSMARVEMMSQNYSSAKAALDTLFELDPDHSTGLSTLAEWYMYQRKYKQAETVMNRVIELTPQDIGQYINLNVVQKKLKKNEEALATLLRAEKLAPSDHRLQKSLSSIYKILNQPQKSQAAQKRAAELLRVQKIKPKKIGVQQR